MAGFEREEIDILLKALEEQGYLFPEFSLVRQENGLSILGTGGFSVVYEMVSRSQNKAHYALKVMGFQPHVTSSDDFRTTARVQRFLMEQTDYVVRVLDTRELWLRLTERGEVCGIWEQAPSEMADNCLHLQFQLMDKLESVIGRNRFNKVSLLRQELTREDEVLKLGFQIGNALLCAHKNQILHRDIKLENIFWDPREECYKLGDFGAAKLTRDGSAETLIFTNGYGAPEIERVLTDRYDASADIYSLGITLYLLLNNLRFPGSDGYRFREIQYHPDFTFPAPENASPGVTRVLRKMCSYHSTDRYGSMTEVLTALAEAAETHAPHWDNPVWMDLPTETYREETSGADPETQTKPESRAARILRIRAQTKTRRREQTVLLLVFTAVFYLCLAGFPSGAVSAEYWQFWLLPAALVLEAVFLLVGGMKIPAGIAAVGLLVYSGSMTGFSVIHILGLVYLLGGMEIPLLSLAAALCLRQLFPPEHPWVLIFGQRDWGWILLTVLMAVSHRAAICPPDEKTGRPVSYRRGYTLVTWLPFLLAGAGIFFLVRQWFWGTPVPDLVQTMHPIRTGLCGFGLYVIQYMFWGITGDEPPEEDIPEEDEVQ